MDNTSTIDCHVALPFQRGFRFAFANGYTVSIQFGTGNYCDVRDYSENQPDEVPECGCVEIGIFKTDCTNGMDWVKLTDHDDVAGWVPVDDVPAILMHAQTAHWDTIRHIIANPNEPTAEEMMDNITEMLDEDAQIAQAAELDM